MFSQITDKTNSICKIRVKNPHTQRYHTKNDLIRHSVPSKILKKQHNNSFFPQLTILPPLKTQSLIKSRRVTIAPISVDSVRLNHRKTTNPQNSMTDHFNQPETEIFKNVHFNCESKASFRTKKLTRAYLPIKNNLSSTFPQKPELSNIENVNQNQSKKLQVQIHDLAQTSTTDRTLIRKIKDNKCLIAVSRKLPFTLQKKSKRKYTEKTDFSSTHQQIFDLDISVIMDEGEAPDTPFLRRDSDIAAVFNFA